MFFGVHIFHIDIFISDLLSKEMILDLDLLCFLVRDNICLNSGCTSVIMENDNWLIIFHFDVLQILFHLENLDTIRCCCYVFNFIYRKRNWGWFMLDQDKRQSPKKSALPLVLFLSSMLPTQFCIYLFFQCEICNLRIPKTKVKCAL